MVRKAKGLIALLLATSMITGQSICSFALEPESDGIEIIQEEEFSDIAEDISADGDLSDGIIEITDELEAEDGSEILSDGDVTSDAFILSDRAKEFKQNLIANADKNDLEKMVEGVDYVAGEVLTLADNEEQAQKYAAAYGGTLKEFSYGIAVISLEDSDYDVEEAYYAGMNMDLEIPAVEPNFITYLTDPVETMEGYWDSAYDEVTSVAAGNWEYSYYQLGYNDPALNPNNYSSIGYQWFHDMIGTYAAWGVTKGSSDIVVAVIDTGVYDEHEDLKGIVDVAGIDMKNGLANNQDMVGHGTHVAGIIAAKGKNNKGGVGVAPGVRILAINACFHDEAKDAYPFTAEDEAKAIKYAAGWGEKKAQANIINMSIGGPIYAEVVQEAVNYAYSRDVTICAAMGNESSNCIEYPAGYEHVIGVASVDQSWKKSYFSSFGYNCDISAPGTAIYSTVTGSTSSYASFNGTSMATPVVAGACALYMSAYGPQKPDDMEKILKSTAVKCSGSGMGAGIVSLENMFDLDVANSTVVLKNNGAEIGKATSKAVTLKGQQPATAVFGFSSGNKKGKENTTIIYTLDGSMPAVSNGTVLNGIALEYNEWNGKTFSVSDIVGVTDKKTTVTIKAIAVSGTGAISKVSSLKFTVEPTADTTEAASIKIVGPANVVKGGSATYKATILPSKAKNKKVSWSLDKASDDLGIKITDKGKLTVPTSVNSGTVIKVKAEVISDKGFAFSTFAVTVTDAKVSSVKITAPKTYNYNKATYNKKGVLTSVTLYNVDIAGTGFETTENKI